MPQTWLAQRPGLRLSSLAAGPASSHTCQDKAGAHQYKQTGTKTANLFSKRNSAQRLGRVEAAQAVPDIALRQRSLLGCALHDNRLWKQGARAS
jgi:hypothetical protein